MGQLRNESFLTPLLEILNNKDLLFFSIDALGDLGFAQAEAPFTKTFKKRCMVQSFKTHLKPWPS
jgi:hypothetical protein